ncbi:hypothetical protein HG530_014110 [Fusarium avenaceum]|nr:hypothetical protein HG530_014110 [Fusarium avenaceum]
MQDTELADTPLLSANTEIHGSSMAREERGIVKLLDPVAVRLAGVLLHLKVNTLAGQTLVVGNESIHREHSDHDVGDNIKLGHVCGGDLNEDIGSVECDLGVVAVDDGRKGADNAIRVVDGRIDWRVADDVEETAQVLVILVEAHQLSRIHLLRLVQGSELDVLGRFDKSVVGRLLFTTEDIEVVDDTFEAEHVISVGRDLNLELRRLLLAIDNRTLIVLGILVKLNTEFEAEVLKLLGRESVTGARNSVSDT